MIQLLFFGCLQSKLLFFINGHVLSLRMPDLDNQCPEMVYEAYGLVPFYSHLFCLLVSFDDSIYGVTFL